jgi:hypothetical protein
MRFWHSTRSIVRYCFPTIPFLGYLFFRHKPLLSGMAIPPSLNLLTATATELQTGLTAGKFNSSQLIDLYLDQITQHNGYLKAVIETAPRSLLQQEANRLDLERADGKLRGPLHGIPILLKVLSYNSDLEAASYSARIILRPTQISDWRQRRGVTHCWDHARVAMQT